jgi:hypothetical protein
VRGDAAGPGGFQAPEPDAIYQRPGDLTVTHVRAGAIFRLGTTLAGRLHLDAKSMISTDRNVHLEFDSDTGRPEYFKRLDRQGR